VKKKRIQDASKAVLLRPDACQAKEKIRRRVIFQLGAIALLICFVIIGLVAWAFHPRSLTESERAALVEYEKIRLALANDDLATALRSAGSLRSRFPQLPISDQASALQKCASLESARQIFKEISHQAVALVRGADGYFIGICPPGNGCPVRCSPCRMDEFGPWVQVSPELKNPYMGKESPRCGVLHPAR
jgi:cbb3-type cytochrome oxidase subunit 3